MRLTPAVRTIYGLEIRSLLRDPRAIFASIILPIVLFPLLLLASKKMEKDLGDSAPTQGEPAQTKTYKYAITGTESEFVRQLVEGLPAPDAEGADTKPIDFKLVDVEDPVQAFNAGDLDFYVQGMTPDEWQAARAEKPTPVKEGAEKNETPVVRIHYRFDRPKSLKGSSTLRDKLHELRTSQRHAKLVAVGFPVDPSTVAASTTTNVASKREMSGSQLGRMLTMFVLILMVAGGSAIAPDTLAGEKERGTLTTLLTSAAARSEITYAKFLAIVTMGLVVTALQVFNLWLYLGMGLIDVPADYAASITPVTAIVLFVLYLPVAGLTSGVLLLTSAYAKTYKEAQLFLLPVILLLIVPTLAPLLPEISLSSAIVMVPIANISIAVRDVLVGQANGWLVGMAWLITGLAAVYATRCADRALNDENLVSGADTDRAELLGGPALFRKRVLRWFAVLWAVKVLIDFNVSFEDLRVTSLVNIGLVFVAAPLVMVWRFELKAKEAFALRMPKPIVWLAVLLGAPAGLIVSAMIFRLASYIVPIPTEMLEQLGQAFLPEDIPFWQLAVFFAVLPGIVEELTFRGALLQGLRTRYHPVMLCVIIGLIFGFFHFQIFRIPSTAVLGMVLTALTLMTGSIFPAMLWHALNNAMALYIGSAKVDLTANSWLAYAGATLALTLSLWVIWKNRTPYPGLRGSDRPSEADLAGVGETVSG